MSQSTVNQFVRQIRSRINRFRSFNVFFWTAFFCGLLMLTVALVYVIPGYAVPPIAYVTIGALAAIAFAVMSLVGRHSNDQAAKFADDFFSLKDSVSSCTHFRDSGQAGGFYELQAAQTERLANQSSISKIRYQFPIRLAGLAMLLIGVSAALGFRGPSEKVIQRLELEKATFQHTADANKQLRELIDELEKSIDNEEELELLAPNKLRKWVDELEETKDRKESMRQYAKLEMKLNKAAAAMQQRKDEKLLDKAAEELAKAKELQSLSKQLKQKKYDKASKDIRDLKPSKLNAEELKKLSKKRKELAKLKAAAKAMANAAKATKRSKSHSAKKGKANANGNPAKSSAAGNGQDAGGKELAEMMNELDDAVEELDEALEELEFADLEDFDGQLEELEDWQECEECEQGVRAKLDQLGKKLTRMARKRSAIKKLKALSSKCSQCQSFQRRVANAGGKKPGVGTDDSVRKERDKLVDNGQTTGLKGLKGSGPSLTKVEAASDGDGVSHRRATATKREFKKQFESFVDREDVPEDLKQGVKNYFTNIHSDGQ